MDYTWYRYLGTLSHTIPGTPYNVYSYIFIHTDTYRSTYGIRYHAPRTVIFAIPYIVTFPCGLKKKKAIVPNRTPKFWSTHGIIGTFTSLLLLLLLPCTATMLLVLCLLQVTDAMYNFVLKLNLATTEGKERFMRRWAVGRIANGESTTPREGWKFLQSLGIDIDKKVNSALVGYGTVYTPGHLGARPG